ncbi:hypothetical protein [Entomospira culicis]|uniref:Uncharacterized protein n=1 Tax=Entomospira culicis TaxID=2719989 RepID=A0A968KWR9_9SPIO|nr:hypothetical protein [Entomospira culicis]NIZ19533.1 hypothetical protein [Entomospira culicis]NIZ69562.1 hypothetical protein [Entomospira culicis]WDI36673.1 hypothetical protein PVA46_04935 [Entomospira culicis]WDI38302.1 hypothetical protein PVA47_04945 [Entomospira culicis]
MKHINKILLLVAGLTLLLLGLLIFSPKQVESGYYDFEELSPVVSRYPNFYALMVEVNDFKLDLESASLSATADLADKLGFSHFILLHREAITFNPAAFALWATVFNLRGQDVQIASAPDRSGARSGYFVMAFFYNEESEASGYALLNSQLDSDVKYFEVATLKKKYRQAWLSPSTAVDLQAEARLRLVHNEALNESINMVIFHNDDSRRWPFLLAIDTSRQEAIANGYPYFIVLEANISGAQEVVAMQVRTRYLSSADLPEDLYKKGYRSFMIWSSGESVLP